MKRILVPLFVFLIAAIASGAAEISDFHVYPNPVKIADAPASFFLQLDAASEFQSATLSIYTESAKLVYKETVSAYADAATGTLTRWKGYDEKGNRLPSGLYYARAFVKTKSGELLTKTTKVVIY